MSDVLTITISNGISSSNSVGVVFGNTMQLSKDRNISYRKKAETVLSKQYNSKGEGEVYSIFERLTMEALKSFIDRKRSDVIKYSEIFNLFEKLKDVNALGAEEIDRQTLRSADFFMRNYVAAFGLNAPKIKIFDDGELSFFWNDKSCAVDLTVEPDETYSFYAKNKNERKGIKGNYNISVTPPEQLLSMLK